MDFHIGGENHTGCEKVIPLSSERLPLAGKNPNAGTAAIDGEIPTVVFDLKIY